MSGAATPPAVVIIQGPTASGKSELAVRLAERCGGEIVNADSMQVYRGMDIGTAKPSAEMRHRVPHHLLDVVDPDEPFSAADFQRLGDEAIAGIVARGRPVFVVGGTGLYIRALLGGLVEAPAGTPEIRGALEEEFRLRGGEALHRELAAVDPETAAALHPNDRVRILRALEIYRVGGVPASLLRSAHGFREERYRSLKIGLTVPREELYRRIDQRVERMMADGLLAEVERLLAAGFARELKSMRSLGYRQIGDFLAGEITLENAVTLIKQETRRYAKRQMTWFNKDFAIRWLAYPENFDTIAAYAMQFLS